jgi:hypothetical protein
VVAIFVRSAGDGERAVTIGAIGILTSVYPNEKITYVT